MKNGEELIEKTLIPKGIGTSGPEQAISQALERSGLEAGSFSHILATGYGRNICEIADSQMSELSCHAKGAAFLFEDVRTVVDVGGQDAKVLQLGDNGALEKFVMNDKCAAGTGRFLDVMARVLDIDVADLGVIGDMSTKTIDISSTCTVFAETEVISRLAQGTAREDVVAGINRTIAIRVSGLVKRIGALPRVVMSGGVAQNHGICRELERELGTEVLISPLSQFAGAIGAALFAFEKGG